MSATEPRPLSEEEAMDAETVVWVGTLACGCSPFSVIDSIDSPMGYDADEAFGMLLAHAVTIRIYSPEDARKVIVPCRHNVVIAANNEALGRR